MLTRLKYMEEPHIYESSAKVVDVLELEDGQKAVILDETLFYPQGGGQPYDVGTISCGDKVFTVKEVRFVEGIVRHIGEFEGEPFHIGDTVALLIDKERRVLNSKLHTLGHVIDEAVFALGYTDWEPGRGYHFPDAPFVEYIAELDKDKIEAFKNQLEQKVNELIQNGFEVKTFSAEREQLQKFCRDIPDYIPKDKPCRVAIVYGDKGMPCGGTHVKNIQEIGIVRIRKVSSKKGRVKVAYELSARRV